MLTQEQITKVVEEAISDPRVQTVLITGSYIYGKPTEQSDLDVRCVTNDGSDWAEFERLRFGTKIEIFFNPPEKVRFYFEECRKDGNAGCIHFWANGKLVYDVNGRGAVLQKEAIELLKKGPYQGTWEKNEKYKI